MALEHVPVLLEEVVTALRPVPGGFYVDGTFGRGGHSSELLRRGGGDIRVLALDRDPEAIEVARALAATHPGLDVVQAPFSEIGHEVERRGLHGAVDGVVLDLGVSSPQLEDPRRGFGFRQDGPLDMRMDPGAGPSAAQWLESAEPGEIERVIRTYGEERYARRIARALVRRREDAPVRTTAALARIVADAVPGRGAPNRHPATRTFQALRIHVNRELEELSAGLEASFATLRPGGRLVVVSFHSLEDRIVKRFIRDHGREEAPPRGLPVLGEPAPGPVRAIGRAVRPGAAEVARNPRSRSAVMRVAERRG